MVRIVPVKMGFVSVFLIEAETGWILVDAGLPGRFAVLERAMTAAGIGFDEIRLVVITHVHYDHVGFLPQVMERTQADLLVHADEAELLRRGNSAPVRITSKLLRVFMPEHREMAVPAAEPTLEMETEYSLQPYGLTGRIIPTPGHTPGSISLILDNQALIVGDIIMRFPLLTGSAFKPMVAIDMPQVFASWGTLLEAVGNDSAYTVYPAHGKPFPAARLRSEYERIQAHGTTGVEGDGTASE